MDLKIVFLSPEMNLQCLRKLLVTSGALSIFLSKDVAGQHTQSRRALQLKEREKDWCLASLSSEAASEPH